MIRGMAEMQRNTVKSLTGWMIITGHVVIIAYIFVGRSDVLDMATRTAAALTVAPITAVYFTNVVKSFVAGASDIDGGERVNWNYAGVSFLIPLLLMVGIIYVLSIYPKEQFTKPEQLQAMLSGLEVCLGGTVGLVVDSLFKHPAH
jgi:hypothetical protein